MILKAAAQEHEYFLKLLSVNTVFVPAVALRRMLNFNAPPMKNTTAEPVWKVTHTHTHTHTLSLCPDRLKLFD